MASKELGSSAKQSPSSNDWRISIDQTFTRVFSPLYSLAPSKHSKPGSSRFSLLSCAHIRVISLAGTLLFSAMLPSVAATKQIDSRRIAIASPAAKISKVNSVPQNPAFTFIDSDNRSGLKEYRLRANGLSVLLAERHTAPVTVVMVVFRVGSRNEAVGYTGSTHFLEHMMFKGTSVHDPLKKTGIDDVLKPLGGYNNATTFYDRTNYYEVIPAKDLAVCIELEADRMRHALLRASDRAAEMTVVRNELERSDNFASSILDTQIFATAFREHPYHHPVIGWRSDVEGVPIERLRQFYNDFYYPNNATLVVIGDFKTADALAMVAKEFSKVAALRKPFPKVYTIEPPQEGERRFVVNHGEELPKLTLGFHIPKATDKDTYPLEILASILGDEKRQSSRLYKRLVDSGLASEASCANYSLRDPGLFTIYASANEGTSLPALEKAIEDELAQIATTPVSDSELDRAKKAVWKHIRIEATDPTNMADQLTEAIAVADWKWWADMEKNMKAVSAADVQRVAKKYFSENNRSVGYCLPKKSPSEKSDDAGKNAETSNDKSIDDVKKGVEKASSSGVDNDPNTLSNDKTSEKALGLFDFLVDSDNASYFENVTKQVKAFREPQLARNNSAFQAISHDLTNQRKSDQHLAQLQTFQNLEWQKSGQHNERLASDQAPEPRPSDQHYEKLSNQQPERRSFDQHLGQLHQQQRDLLSIVPAKQDPVDTKLSKELLDKKTAKPGSFESKISDRIKKKVLANGLTVYVLPVPSSKCVAVAAKIRAGDYFAPKGKNTLPSFVVEMLNKGSKKTSKEELADAMEKMGASFDPDSENFWSEFKAEVVVEDLDQYLALASEAIRQPLFNQDELDKIKKQTEAALADAMVETGQLAQNKLLGALYKPDCVYYEKPFSDQLTELKTISTADMIDFHRKYYTASNAIIAIVGDISPEKAFASVEQSFGMWEKGERFEIALNSCASDTEKRLIVSELKDKTSVDIVIGRPADLSIKSKDFYAAQLANAALGHDTIASRLAELRIKYGLTYGVESSFSEISEPYGAWTIQLSVNPENTEKSLSLVKLIVSDYVSKGITADELSTEKKRLTGEYIVNRLRTPAHLAAAISRYAMIGIGPQFIDQYAENLNKVTLQEVNQAIRKYMRLSECVTSLAGSIPGKIKEK